MAGSQTLTDKEIVLLGLIAEEPIHAYRLEEKIHERRLTEWTDISFSSIYRVLKGLEEKGLINKRLEHEGQGATRKVYEILEPGRRALSDNLWFLLSYMKPLKNPFLIALANISRVNAQQRLDGLERRLKSIAGLERNMEEIERIHGLKKSGTGQKAKGAKVPADKRGLVGVKLICRSVRAHLKAEREFVRWALDYLGKLDESSDSETESNGKARRDGIEVTEADK